MPIGLISSTFSPSSSCSSSSVVVSDRHILKVETCLLDIDPEVNYSASECHAPHKFLLMLDAACFPIDGAGSSLTFKRKEQKIEKYKNVKKKKRKENTAGKEDLILLAVRM